MTSIYQITNGINTYYGSSSLSIEKALDEKLRMFDLYQRIQGKPFHQVFELFETGNKLAIQLIDRVDASQANKTVQMLIDNNKCINTTKRYTSPADKKQRLKLAAAIIITCECGINIRTDAIAAHRRTSTHFHKLNGTTPHSQHECECGGRYQFRKKAAHEATKKHQTWLLN